MMTRACFGGGMVTAIPNWSDPDVIEWGPTAEDSTYAAAKEHIDLSHKVADAEVCLALEFAAQQRREYEQIRARA